MASDVTSVADTLVVSLTRTDLLCSRELLRIFQWIVYAVGCQIVDVFGTVTNIINIVCFVKQGFKDSVNVSLLGLAISDLGCLVTLIFTNICFNPAFQDLDLPFESAEFQYLVSGWPHIIFSRVTSWITAFITLERCLCITMPLKVKLIITSRRVTVILISIFVVLICSVSPIYCVNRFGMKFSLLRNRTIMGLVFTPEREKVETASFAVNNILVPFTSFVLIVVCTIILVVNLKKKTRWRAESTWSGQPETLSNRDQKVTQMIVIISSLFIACFIPVSILFTAILIVPGMTIDGPYGNLSSVIIAFGFLLESTNSAMNIFIYYKMSSKYRAVFRQLFRLSSENERPSGHSRLSRY